VLGQELLGDCTVHRGSAGVPELGALGQHGCQLGELVTHLRGDGGLVVLGLFARLADQVEAV
jgi:hypothetical protein